MRTRTCRLALASSRIEDVASVHTYPQVAMIIRWRQSRPRYPAMHLAPNRKGGQIAEYLPMSTGFPMHAAARIPPNSDGFYAALAYLFFSCHGIRWAAPG